jgi:type IV pilus assembly protein PilV
MNKLNSLKKAQDGSVLLEALIAILIFSMGILAIVGLQAASIKTSTDAKYRSDASMLANQLIGQMWVSNRTTIPTQFASSPAGAAYTSWLNDVQATLPGATGTNAPSVTIVTNPLPLPTSAPTHTVNMILRWQSPGESSPHSYAVNTQINQ